MVIFATKNDLYVIAVEQVTSVPRRVNELNFFVATLQNPKKLFNELLLLF